MYRTLHGAPMLAGVPAHYTLALVGVAALLGFGVMAFDKVAGVVVVVGALATWGMLAVVYGRDRAQVPLFLLRVRYSFPRRITSYTPVGQRAAIFG